MATHVLHDEAACLHDLGSPGQLTDVLQQQVQAVCRAWKVEDLRVLCLERLATLARGGCVVSDERLHLVRAHFQHNLHRAVQEVLGRLCAALAVDRSKIHGAHTRDAREAK
eukprot:347148-Chlamydomonas_euryale.AAC.1